MSKIGQKNSPSKTPAEIFRICGIRCFLSFPRYPLPQPAWKEETQPFVVGLKGLTDLRMLGAVRAILQGLSLATFRASLDGPRHIEVPSCLRFRAED